MRASRGIAGACALASLFAAAPAFAQSQPPEATPQTGPRSTAPVNSLLLSLTSQFETNVPRINDQGRNPRNLVKRDIRTTPSADLIFSRNLGRQQFGVRSSVGYDIYARNSQLDSWRFLVQPNAYLDLPVCDLKAEASVSRQQSDLGELVYFGVDPTASTSNIEIRKRAEGTLICGDGLGLRPTFTVARDVGDNENPLRRRADFRSTRLQPGLSYSSPALGTVSAYAVRVDTDLPYQPVAGGITGYRQKGYGLSYLRDIGRYLTFDGSVSHMDIQPRGGGLGTRSGVNYDLALTVQPTEQLQLQGKASRAFSSSLTSISAYELDQDYGLTINYAANSRLRFVVGGSVSPREFFYDQVPPGLFIKKQTQKSIFAGARTDLGRRFRLSLNAGYDTRDADISTFDYRAFHTSVGISFQY